MTNMLKQADHWIKSRGMLIFLSDRAVYSPQHSGCVFCLSSLLPCMAGIFIAHSCCRSITARRLMRAGACQKAQLRSCSGGSVGALAHLALEVQLDPGPQAAGVPVVLLIVGLLLQLRWASGRMTAHAAAQHALWAVGQARECQYGLRRVQRSAWI